jgi:hypothetical protein
VSNLNGLFKLLETVSIIQLSCSVTEKFLLNEIDKRSGNQRQVMTFPNSVIIVSQKMNDKLINF